MKPEIYFKGRKYHLSKSTNGVVTMESFSTGSIRWFDSEAQFREWSNK